MKKIIAILAVIVLLFSFVGCGKQITKITNFERFSTMSKGADKIEVEFDNNTGVPFYFTITDRSEIDAIMDIVFSSAVEDAGKEPMAGDNTSFTIFQGEKEYRMSFRVNKEGSKYYNFVTADLQDKIRELATNAGAYNSTTDSSIVNIDAKDVKEIYVSTLPESDAYKRTISNESEIVNIINYINNMDLEKDFPENPNEYYGMTIIIKFIYNNNSCVEVYSFGNMFIMVDNEPWLRMKYEEAEALGKLVLP